MTVSQCFGDSIHALIFDVDGTLYHQGALRRRMLCRLIYSHAIRPVEGWRTARILSAYRRTQEKLRPGRSGREIDLGLAQLQRTADAVGIDLAIVTPIVRQWMEREPLSLLPACAPRSLKSLLCNLRERGIRLGVLSDYPAEDKLAALGIDQYFQAIVCAQDPGVQTFKPDPRGLLVALERLGVDGRNALYVGDRADVDLATARNAGVRCVILGGKHKIHTEEWAEVAELSELDGMLSHG